MDEEEKRKLKAKRFNESLKLLATTFNAIALVIFAGSVLQPLLGIGTRSDVPQFVNWPWLIVSAILHLSAHALIRLVRLE